LGDYSADAGQLITFTPNFACSASGTLALNGLAAKNLYESNGTTAITLASGYAETLVWDPALNAAAGGWKRPVKLISTPVTYIAAVCQNTSASLGFSSPTSNPAVAACVTGSNTQFGVAQFADAGNTTSVQGHFPLPSDWAGAIDLKGKWRTAATSGNVVWQVSTICVADAETSDPAFNTASTVTDATKGTTLQQNDFSTTAITITGCAAGEELYFRFFRDPTNGSDTIAATADLISLTFIYKRAI
jgi:hypothetical protein